MTDASISFLNGPKSRRAAAFAVAGAALCVCLFTLFHVAHDWVARDEIGRAEARATLYRSAVSAAIKRLEHLPGLLAEDPLVEAAARGGPRQTLNARLERIANDVEVEAIYLMDADGLTIAASNHAGAQTFIGQRYDFRPYFTAALAGDSGEFFAIGATTSRPGFFLSAPVRADADIAGVLAVKLDLGALTADWRVAEELVLVTNEDGVVILASDNALLYQTLAPLDQATRDQIASDRQFADKRLAPLDWFQFDDQVRLAGTPHLYVAAPIEGTGWRIHLLADQGRVRASAWLAVAVFAALTTLIAASVFALRSERFRAALRVSQDNRRALQSANERLKREIAERRSAEARAREAEDELRRAGKLAALGQLAASVTHELGQPLSAMRNYLAAASFGGAAPVEKLSGLVDRMDATTKQLRFFARVGPVEMTEVDLAEVAENAIELVRADAKKMGVSIDFEVEANAKVRGVPLRLEQVAVNLLRNAVLAAAETGGGVVVRVASEGDRARLVVDDDGPGFGAAGLAPHLEPFSTTRASGDGMGLGLAISSEIVKEHDGALTGASRPGGGARVEVNLKAIDRT